MTVGDGYRITVVSQDNQTLEKVANSWAYIYEGNAVEATEAEDLITAWVDEVQGAYRALMSTGFNVVIIVVAELPGGLSVAERGIVTDNQGAASGDVLPYQCAGVITWITATLGRRGKGRSFMPPTAESFNGGTGVCTSGYVTLLNSFATAAKFIAGDLSHGDWSLAVFSQADQAVRPVVSHVARNYWGVQRSRRPRN
jgi:hypothetical protein